MPIADETRAPALRGRSWLLALFKWGVGGFFLVLILLAIWVGPDQVRSLPEPPAPGDALASRWGVVDRALDSGETAVSEEPGANTAAEHMSLIDDAIRDLLPIPDLTLVPESLREKATEVNERFMQLAADFVALGENAGAYSYVEASKELMRIQKDRWELITEWSLASEGTKPRVYLEGVGEQATWDELALHALLTVSVAHEDWHTAASACWGLGGNGPTHDPVWWDREVYYLRQAGLRGRGLLAFRTVMPGLYRVAQSVGPDDL